MNIRMSSKVRVASMSETPSMPSTRSPEVSNSKMITNDANVSEKDTKKMVEELNKLLEHEKIHAEYSVHEGFGDIIIKIVDNETKQVVKEFPKEKVIDMVRKLCDIAGILIDKKI